MAAELVRYVNMPEAALRSLVPKQSGLYFCGCPNCEGGTQEGNMEWSPGNPEHVHCKSCGHVYPSPNYPMTHEVRVKSPRGEEHVYRYHQDPRGRQYFFEARIWYAKIHYYDGVALRLAQVYDATRDERYPRAAAVLLDQYAHVVPGYVPKFDYPFRAKQFFGAEVKPPYPVTPYRASRYSWWAYMDVPDELALAYDLIASSTALDSEMRARIERDLIRGSVDWVLLNPEQLTNMAPGVWQSMVQAGRIVGEPDYIHDAVERARRFLCEQFFYDHFWREGSPSYHLQSVEYLQSALDMMKGYSDPAGYVSPRDGQHYENLDPDSLFPELPKARAVAELMRLPDGRYAPVHDTWWTHKGEPLQKSEPHLLPTMGYAILGSGTGKDQVQVHLAYPAAMATSTWTISPCCSGPTAVRCSPIWATPTPRTAPGQSVRQATTRCSSISAISTPAPGPMAICCSGARGTSPRWSKRTAGRPARRPRCTAACWRWLSGRAACRL